MIKRTTIGKSGQELAAYLPLVTLLVFCLWRYATAPIGDFGNYYYASVLWVNNQFTADVYFPHFFNSTIEQLTGNFTFLSFAPNSPFIALILAPFSWLKPLTAKWLFNALSALLYVVSIRQLQRVYSVSLIMILLVPIVFLIPIKNQLLFGQLYFLLLFLLVQWLLAVKRQYYWLAALWWALAVAIKLFPALLILPLLFQRKFKMLLPMMVMSGLIVGATFLLVPYSVIECFIFEVMPRSLNGEIAGLYVDNYQSWHMFLKRVLVFHEVENPMGLLKSTHFFHAILMAFKIMILGLLWNASKKELAVESIMAMTLFCAVLLMDYGSTYLMLMLIPAFFFSSRIMSMKYRVVFSLVLLVALNISFTSVDFPFSYLRLVLLTATGMAILISEIKNRQKVVWIVGALGFLVGWFKPVSPAVDRFATPFSMPILTYDYRISGNQIWYEYNDGKGRKESAFDWLVPIVETKPLQIIANQVYVNGQPITHSNSFKKKAILVNQNQVLYLSDQGRGIGFYQLRQIHVTP